MKLKLRKQKAGWNGRERFIKTSKFVVPCGAPLYFHSDEKLRRWRAAAWTIQGGKKRGRGKRKRATSWIRCSERKFRREGGE